MYVTIIKLEPIFLVVLCDFCVTVWFYLHLIRARIPCVPTRKRYKMFNLFRRWRGEFLISDLPVTPSSTSVDERQVECKSTIKNNHNDNNNNNYQLPFFAPWALIWSSFGRVRMSFKIEDINGVKNVSTPFYLLVRSTLLPLWSTNFTFEWCHGIPGWWWFLLSCSSWKKRTEKCSFVGVGVPLDISHCRKTMCYQRRLTDPMAIGNQPTHHLYHLHLSEMDGWWEGSWFSDRYIVTTPARSPQTTTSNVYCLHWFFLIRSNNNPTAFLNLLIPKGASVSSMGH